MAKKVGNTEIQARIKVLETHFNKSGNTLGKEIGLGNTTVDDWNDNQLGNPTLHCREFLSRYNINRGWWKTGEGEVFNTSDEKKSDYKQKPSGGKADSIAVLREVLEEGTEYRIIPKTVLEGEYRIMPKKELDKYERQFDKIDERTKIALSAKDEVIQMKDELLKDRDQKIREREDRILSLEKLLNSGQKTD